MRKSGILLHITSLPSEEGIGTMGKYAYKFIDFMKLTGIKLWQILPLGHIGYGNSPYQTFSAFAGNPYMINLQSFTENIDKNDNAFHKCDNDNSVDYSEIIKDKLEKLKYFPKNTLFNDEYFFEFCSANSFWLEDYSLFMVLKDKFDGLPWYEWTDEFKFREKNKIAEFRITNEPLITQYKMMQYMFFNEWLNLKTYANNNGVQIVGDMPLYVSLDSSDVWSHPELFLLDDKLAPITVAGVPPDYFSEEGQLWGNPLYDWEEHRKTNFEWWMRRFEQGFELFDYIRFDHFRGLESYWSVPNEAKNAVSGNWVKAPGEELLDKIITRFGFERLMAEDLGIITQEVKDLRDKFNLRGMKILQFAFSATEESDYLPHNHIKNCVVYTGTHDNDTLKGWLTDDSVDALDKQYAFEYLNTNFANFVDSMIRTAYASSADMVIVPMQDWLGLDNTARMNIPGESENNWSWRMSKSELTQDLADRIKKMVEIYRR